MRLDFLRVPIADVSGVRDFGPLDCLHETFDDERVQLTGAFVGEMCDLLFLIQPVVVIKSRSQLQVIAGVQSWRLYVERCGPDHTIPVILLSGIAADELNELIVADVLLRACLALRTGSSLGSIARLWRKSQAHALAPSVWALISSKRFSFRTLANQLKTSTTALFKKGAS